MTEAPRLLALVILALSSALQWYVLLREEPLIPPYWTLPVLEVEDDD